MTGAPVFPRRRTGPRRVVLVAGFVLALAASAAEKLPARLGLEDLARRYGLTAERAASGRELRLESRWTSLVFTAGSREAAWNGFRLFLGEPVQAGRGTLQLSRTDWLAVVRPLLDPAAVPPPGAPGLIVIDPGHGGADPGAENRAAGLREKTLTLDLARRLRADLEQRGYRVALTRDADQRLRTTQAADLQQRAVAANRLGAAVFISLHFNSLPSDPRVGGIETYTLTPAGHRSTAAARPTRGDATVHPGNRHDHWNAVLGAAIHRRLVDGLKATDRGLKRARFAVLRPMKCPAVLVEAGFLTHPAEARQLGTATYRQRLAEAIGAGVADYHARVREAGKG